VRKAGEEGSTQSGVLLDDRINISHCSCRNDDLNYSSSTCNVHGETIKLPHNNTDLGESTALDLQYQQSDYEDGQDGEDMADLEGTYQIPDTLT